MSIEQRIADILDLAAQEGIVLPLPVELIVVYELAGHTVDLRDGRGNLARRRTAVCTGGDAVHSGTGGQP